MTGNANTRRVPATRHGISAPRSHNVLAKSNAPHSMQGVRPAHHDEPDYDVSALLPRATGARPISMHASQGPATSTRPLLFACGDSESRYKTAAHPTYGSSSVKPPRAKAHNGVLSGINIRAITGASALPVASGSSCSARLRQVLPVETNLVRSSDRAFALHAPSTRHSLPSKMENFALKPKRADGWSHEGIPSSSAPNIRPLGRSHDTRRSYAAQASATARYEASSSAHGRFSHNDCSKPLRSPPPQADVHIQIVGTSPINSPRKGVALIDPGCVPAVRRARERQPIWPDTPVASTLVDPYMIDPASALPHRLFASERAAGLSATSNAAELAERSNQLEDATLRPSHAGQYAPSPSWNPPSHESLLFLKPDDHHTSGPNKQVYSRSPTPGLRLAKSTSRSSRRRHVHASRRSLSRTPSGRERREHQVTAPAPLSAGPLRNDHESLLLAYPAIPQSAMFQSPSFSTEDSILLTEIGEMLGLTETPAQRKDSQELPVSLPNPYPAEYSSEDEDDRQSVYSVQSWASFDLERELDQHELIIDDPLIPVQRHSLLQEAHLRPLTHSRSFDSRMTAHTSECILDGPRLLRDDSYEDEPHGLHFYKTLDDMPPRIRALLQASPAHAHASDPPRFIDPEDSSGVGAGVPVLHQDVSLAFHALRDGAAFSDTHLEYDWDRADARPGTPYVDDLGP